MTAKARNLPVMLSLVDPRSYPMNWLDGFVLADSRIVQATKDRVIPLRLNSANVGQGFYDRYRVPNVPAIIFLTPDGQPYWRVVGRIGADSFCGQLDKAAQLFPHVKRCLQAVSKGKGSAEELSLAASASVAMGHETVALGFLRRAERLAAKPNPFISEAALAIADTYRVAGRFQDAMPILNQVIKQGSPPYVARALYGIAICQWRTGNPQTSIESLNRLSAMGDVAGDYRFLSRRLLGRMAMLPTAYQMRRVP